MSNNTLVSPSLTTVTGTLYQCLTCNKQYKRKVAYTRHQQTVAAYNTIPSDCYVLPVNATKEFKKTIVFMIKEWLKLHFRNKILHSHAVKVSFLQSLEGTFTISI